MMTPQQIALIGIDATSAALTAFQTVAAMIREGREQTSVEEDANLAAAHDKLAATRKAIDDLADKG